MYNYTTVGWLGAARRAQLDRDMDRLTRGEFCWPVGGMTTIEVIQYERLIEFYEKKLLFIMYYINLQMIN